MNLPRPRRRITMEDLNYVIHRSAKNIIEFPVNATIPGAFRPLTEGEARVLCIMEAVLSMADKEADVVLDIPNSESIHDV